MQFNVPKKFVSIISLIFSELSFFSASGSCIPVQNTEISIVLNFFIIFWKVFLVSFSFLLVSLKENKIYVTQERYFPDHHNYSDIEMENLIKKSRDMDATLLTTEKDYCRIKNIYKKDVNFLKINFKMVNENKFVEDIKKELWKA